MPGRGSRLTGVLSKLPLLENGAYSHLENSGIQCRTHSSVVDNPRTNGDEVLTHQLPSASNWGMALKVINPQTFLACLTEAESKLWGQMALCRNAGNDNQMLAAVVQGDVGRVRVVDQRTNAYQLFISQGVPKFWVNDSIPVNPVGLAICLEVHLPSILTLVMAWWLC